MILVLQVRSIPLGNVAAAYETVSMHHHQEKQWISEERKKLGIRNRKWQKRALLRNITLTEHPLSNKLIPTY